SVFRKVGKGYANLREAAGEDIDLAMHCTGQFDTRSAIGLCKAIEPADPLWIEDPLTVNYSEAWLELKRSTRVPLLAGEKVELVRGFRPYLDNQVLDMIHPDVAYSGGITGCKKIADYAALTRTPVGQHSGPCSLIRFYASVHLAGAIQNFFKIEKLFKTESKNPNALEATPDGLWVCDQITEIVYKVDWNTGKTLLSFPTESHNTSGLAVGGGYVWIDANGPNNRREKRPTDHPY